MHRRLRGPRQRQRRYAAVRRRPLSGERRLLTAPAILWIATKPPWPPVDGGRLLVQQTLEAVAACGARVTLVSPCGPDDDRELIAAALRRYCLPELVVMRPRPRVLAAVRAVLGSRPVTVVRHTSAAIRARVAAILDTTRVDVVHAEQVQALAQCGPAVARRVPVVLRAQNVESDLWTKRASTTRVLATALRREARRMAAWERAAVHESAATVAVTEADAHRLAAIAGSPAKIDVIRAPFPAELPAGRGVAGDPPVVLFGSRGWFPNHDGAAWFLRAVWPRVLDALPAGCLHVFGVEAVAGDPRNVVRHGAPADSRDAFPAGAILAVPLRVASGVRMKILEAWARGVPVVATREAAAGLEARSGEELLLADDAAEFAAAVAAVHRNAACRRALIDAGRRLLRRRHDPADVARELLALYAAVSS